MTDEQLEHRTWALAEREQTDGVLLAFLVTRMSEEKALARMADIPNYPEIPEARNET